jgi:Ca2+-binding EF-hand superfamily protein
MFAAMDADGDGVISKAELRKAIKALKTLDADDDGNITLAEASVGGAPIAAGGPLGEDPQIAQIMANDKNGDGKLTPNEVPREMVPLLRGVDQNADGEISREELVVAMANMRNQFGGGPWRGASGPAGGAGTANQATGQFLRFDKNGDGQLTEDELPPDATRMLKGADRNGDGAIDAGELQAALAQQGGRARALRGGVDPDEARGRANVRTRKPPGDNN